MVIIVIRRFARIDREAEFRSVFQDQAPRDNPDFVGETLTRLDPGAEIPAHVGRLFEIEPGGVNYVNVARWRSWAAFAAQFAPQLANSLGYDPEIETQPARLSVLDAGDEVRW